MTHESEKDTGSQSRTPPSPDPTRQRHSPIIFGGPMVSAPGADVRPRPAWVSGSPFPLATPFRPRTTDTPYPSVGSAWRYGQTLRSEDDVSGETEDERTISRLRLDVEYERARRMQCETRLQEQHRRLARQRDLYEGYLDRLLKEQSANLRIQFDSNQRKLKHELEEKEKEVTERTRMWKKAATELNKLRATAQGFYQITDEYLIGLIVRLRYSIRNFSFQYFEGTSPPKISIFAKLPNYLNHARAIMPGKEAEIYAGVHSKKNYQIIQALTWRVLVAEVFNKFTWVGGKTSESFKHLHTKLDPAWNSDSRGIERPEPEAERKFQTWSATTIGLLLDAQGPEEQSQIEKWQKKEVSRIVGCLLNTFDTIAGSREDLADELSSIIGEAFVLGKEISRQIARIAWTLDLEKEQEAQMFDAETMELETGDLVKKPRVVNWVVAPGVIKRGKSTGEGFRHEEMLLKRIVSCDEDART
ncbi:uncharacterized protein NECHADRAFT_85974 [Fusarium vanettenii 77-13-4]|uniref:Uncharacterized protein n=1 Tax=Fusarium vanettenii (strain ATCC MYA-4622 / CBS 123669 / FGSC 9596 / NRRL 45880 / 77-13-4) TaxID=660122 RepID=C7Z200_FUSV7|nr:uncharacterized protein NECHADRAFT_85974 [Fusarium vanettenii 77-13-4]EEU42087.1 hypothetical protein NECHADRAFT_85974 [Fusarium vanettenii 77-13-4]